MLSEREVEQVKQAQDLARRKKAKSDVIDCPFYFVGSIEICYLCHKWMGTDIDKYVHPCGALNYEQVTERFWRRANGG